MLYKQMKRGIETFSGILCIFKNVLMVCFINLGMCWYSEPGMSSHLGWQRSSCKLEKDAFALLANTSWEHHNMKLFNDMTTDQEADEWCTAFTQNSAAIVNCFLKVAEVYPILQSKFCHRGHVFKDLVGYELLELVLHNIRKTCDMQYA